MLRVCSFSVSLDGYGAGPDQSLETPLGVGGEALHGWLVATRTFQQLYGAGEGTTETDDRGHFDRPALELETALDRLTRAWEDARGWRAV